MVLIGPYIWKMTDKAVKVRKFWFVKHSSKATFCDTPKIFQETKSHVFETDIDEKL